MQTVTSSTESIFQLTMYHNNYGSSKLTFIICFESGTVLMKNYSMYMESKLYYIYALLKVI